MADNRQIQFGIREIKELEFFVDEWKDAGKSFEFTYAVDIIPDSKTESLRIAITASYLNAASKEAFLRGKVLTGFHIKEMKSYARMQDNGRETVDLPEQFWVALFSIAFTHARAILARSSAGSKFADLLMPVINPQQEFQKLFGKFLKPETI